MAEYKPWAWRPLELTESDTAIAFAAWTQSDEQTQYHVIFCPALGWCHWTGFCYETDSELQALAAVGRFTELMLADARAGYRAACDDAAQQGLSAKAAAAITAREAEYLAFAQKSRSARFTKAVLELAAPRLAHSLDEFDSDAFSLNTPGGLVDLRTGEMAPHSPAQLCTKITAVSPGDDGEDLWREFIRKVTCADDEPGGGNLAAYLQCVAGMAAVGRVLEEKAFFLLGSGSNGKSTFLSCLAGVLGSYSYALPADVLTTSREQTGAVFAELQGRRLAVCSELEQGRRLMPSRLKMLTSTDKIPCERKYRQPESFVPSHTLLLASNFLPRIGASDNGTWRRLVVVPFNATFERGGDTKNFAQVLLDKAGPAILRWVVQGAQMFLALGGKLVEPLEVQSETTQYREREDWLQSFLLDACEVRDGASVRSSEMYRAYRNWCAETGNFVLKSTEFADAMRAAGFDYTKTHGLPYYRGVTLLPQYRDWSAEMRAI